MANTFEELAQQAGYTPQEIEEYKQRSYRTQRSQEGWRGLGAPDVPIRNVSPEEETLRTTRGMVPESQINRERGAPFGSRFKASFTSSPEARLKSFQESVGAENVRVTPAGEILVRDPETQGWNAVDPEGPDIGDIADLPGDIPEIAGQVAGGTIAKGGALARMLWSMIGSGAGRAAKGAVGGDLSAGDVAGAAVTGLVTQGMGEALPTHGGGVKEALSRRFAEKVKEQGSGRFAKQNIELIKSTNQPMLASQISQDPWMSMIEGYAQRSPMGFQQFALGERDREVAAAKEVRRLLRMLPTHVKKSEEYGTQLSDALGTELSRLLEKRDVVSKEMFGFLDESLGRKQIIPVPNYIRAVEEAATKLRQSGFDMDKNAADTLLRRAKTTEGLGTASASGIQQMLAELGAASYGKNTGRFFENLDLADRTRFAKELQDALLKDLEEAGAKMSGLEAQGVTATGGGRVQRAAENLRRAREAWKMTTDPIDELRALPIMGIMERQKTAAPEEISAWITNPKRHPSEVRNLMKVLQTTNPEVADSTAQHLLSEAYKAGQKGAGPAGFDRRAFLDALPNQQVLEAIYKGAPQATTFSGAVKQGAASQDTAKDFVRDVGRLGQALERNTWRSGQAPMLQTGFWLLSAQVGKSILRGDPTPLMAAVVMPKAVAKFAHMGPNDREIFIKALERTAAGQPLTNPMVQALTTKILPPIFHAVANTLDAESIEQGPMQ